MCVREGRGPFVSGRTSGAFCDESAGRRGGGFALARWVVVPVSWGLLVKLVAGLLRTGSSTSASDHHLRDGGLGE